MRPRCSVVVSPSHFRPTLVRYFSPTSTTHSDGKTETTSPSPTNLPSTGNGLKGFSPLLIAGPTTIAGIVIGGLLLVYIMKRIKKERLTPTHEIFSAHNVGNFTPALQVIPGLEPFTLQNRRLHVGQPESATDSIAYGNMSAFEVHPRDSMHSSPEVLIPSGDRALYGARQGEGSESNYGPSAIPVLLERLNRVMAMLPPGGISVASEAEDPPEYSEIGRAHV